VSSFVASYNIDVQPRLRFDRNELAGAFGDIGTDLPLVIGMILAAGLHSASVLVMFGTDAILHSFAYRMPMPVQPLKAVAVIVITQHIAPGVLYGGGLAIGIAMLILTLTGGIDWLARVVPRAVVRGLQLGLGLQLATLALGNYVRHDGARGLRARGDRIRDHYRASRQPAFPAGVVRDRPRSQFTPSRSSSTHRQLRRASALRFPNFNVFR
jgi:hypothetical protein